MTLRYQSARSVSSSRLRRVLAGAPVRIAVLLIAFIWTLPSAGLLISSLRPANDITASGWWTVFAHPFESSMWTVENYVQVLTAHGLANAILNSVLVTIPSVVIPITIAAFAAYAFAWLEFPGRKLLFTIVVGLMVVPLQLALVPLLRIYMTIDLNGTFLGLWLAHTGFGLPLAVFLLFGYISTLPGEIIESAQVDGASPLTTFTRLVLPLSIPVVASFAIFQFLWVWNDLLVALVFLGTREDVVVLTARVAALVGRRGEQWHVLTAGAFVNMAVPLLIFFSLQRYFVRGLTAGSVKG
jgi:alpha-glucoside transport system permease protein